ncbi:MAG TPA: hypothetical protein DHN29_21090 [Cytophagales bacterium]|nr:hypothetical protein [Cytophagales bacterium]|tara:strand:+ start:2303 stop:2833 length:531 start_codon:yes stop_codon:yes gene_type:complete
MTNILVAEKCLNPNGGILPEWMSLFKRGIKNKPIRVKPITEVFRDHSVIDKFLMKTLEGKEEIDHTNMMCMGAIDDPWQQPLKNVKKNYDFDTIDKNGWIIFEPKPDAPRNVFQVTETMVREGNSFEVVALWGEERDGEFYQKGVVGDYIANMPDNPDDVYIIAEKVFKATYTIED